MVTDQDILNSLNLENDTFDKLRSNSEEFERSISKGFYKLISILSIVLLLGIISSYTYFIFKEKSGALIAVFFLLILLIIFIRASSIAKAHYARKQYTQFEYLLGERPVWTRVVFPENLEPMRKAYLYTKLRPAILRLSPSERKSLINNYLKAGELNKSNKWYLVTLLGILQFAVWTGYISAVISDSNSLAGKTMCLLIFMVVSLAVTVYVYVYKNSLERTFLKKSKQYFLLAEMITKIDTLIETTSQIQPIPELPVS